MAVAKPKPDARQDSKVDPDLLRTMYRHMVRARVLDERMWVLNRQGRAPFVISCQGHEAAQVGMAMALRPGYDWLAPYYRDLAVTLVIGMTPRDHLLAVLARAADPNSGARQMPAHYGCRRLNIITGGSPVATQVLHAAGAALASKVRGEDAVALTSLGEGSTSEGDFHEGLNFAAVHRLPVICVVENNGYAISVPWEKQGAIKDVAQRAQGYGMPGVIVDGTDVVACYHAAVEAVARGRRGEGPTLIEAKVARLTPHSSDDDDRVYRSREEVADNKAHDCVARFRLELEESGVLAPGDAAEIRAEAMREVDRALEEAEASPLPSPESALLHVYAEDV
ncbi:MAG TPA: thiamine pyrophosphate-dependent dehydrogenase E1 component subunit alpha [Candidatus Dormibacteraeota bacterium]|nr:thiamine pyrophosphate-dependent dehydrogenase E1 component subunit alpha [Candidatus Dormibacteraeota bacterium]